MLKLKKEKNSKDYLLQDIAVFIHSGIKDIYNEEIELFNKLEYIFIELQPTINPRMKFVSHVIYSQLISFTLGSGIPLPTMRFISARNKMKLPMDPKVKGILDSCSIKNSYKNRKWRSIQYTKWFLETLPSETVKCELNDQKCWLEHFEKHDKQDDLADVFSYCVYLIYNKKV